MHSPFSVYVFVRENCHGIGAVQVCFRRRNRMPKMRTFAMFTLPRYVLMHYWDVWVQFLTFTKLSSSSPERSIAVATHSRPGFGRTVQRLKQQELVRIKWTRFQVDFPTGRDGGLESSAANFQRKCTHACSLQALVASKTRPLRHFRFVAIDSTGFTVKFMHVFVIIFFCHWPFQNALVFSFSFSW